MPMSDKRFVTEPFVAAPRTRATEERRHALLMETLPEFKGMAPEEAEAYLAKLDHWHELAVVEVFEERRRQQECYDRARAESRSR